MREIKFRAWDNNRHGYCYFDLFHCWGGLVKGTGIPYLDIRENITEQFTGLRDKNGREIYEGDILKFDLQDYNGGDHFYVCAVEFGGAEFGCKHEDDDYWYWNSLNDITENDDEMEVLGNIHENPELLK